MFLSMVFPCIDGSFRLYRVSSIACFILTFQGGLDVNVYVLVTNHLLLLLPFPQHLNNMSSGSFAL